MDALARLLGEEREDIGEGFTLSCAPASAYIRAYSARKSAGDDDQIGSLAFLAELIAGGLHDKDGALVFKSGAEAADRLPVDFIMGHADTVFRLNALDTEDGEESDEPDEGKAPTTS